MVLSCIKQLSALLRGITSRNNSNFYFLSCFHSFRKKKLEFHKKPCESTDFCNEILDY